MRHFCTPHFLFFLSLFTSGTFSAVFSEPVSARSLDRILAVVGSTPILQSDVKQRSSLIKSSAAYSNILGLGPKAGSPQKVLEMMIEEEVIAAASSEIDINISDTDVNKQIDSIARQNKIKRTQLVASLKQEGIPFDAYARNIKLQLQKRGIMERELRGQGGHSDSDLRKLYQERAMREYQIVLLDVPKNKQGQLKKDFKPADWDTVAIKYPTQDLGWVAASNLKKNLSSALRKSKTYSLIGPFNFGKTSQLVYIRGERFGSEEEFQKVKGQIAAGLQAKNAESRFNTWLETKKKEMHIVVNKL